MINYNNIYDFCKIKNKNNFTRNNNNKPSARVEYLIKLIESENIDYELDEFYYQRKGNNKKSGFNIILKGASNKMVTAHHDVINTRSDNANDNSASVINVLMLKKLLPETHVVILDGEEIGGVGSQRLSDQIKNRKFGDIKWVLNLELTGKGGQYFFIGDYPGKLSDHIQFLFNKCSRSITLFNDSDIFSRNDIDSTVINTLPLIEDYKINSRLNYKFGIKWGNVYLDDDLIDLCHTNEDSLNTIDVNDMKEFVEKVLIKILTTHV